MLESSLFQIWYKNKWKFFSFLLFPLSILYYIGWKMLDFYYSLFCNEKDLKCPVISVGNITVGGTGKTPFIIFLIEFFLKRNIKNIVVLTRGYKGKKLGYIEDVDGEPDEARIIKRKFPEVIVLANPDRYRIFNEYFNGKKLPQIVLLDDGFQHRRIKRNLNIVMVDGDLKFGNGFLIPAGPLREPLSSIRKRGDLVVIKNFSSDIINKFEKPIFHFNYYNLIFKDRSGTELSIDKLLNKEIIAFCGIANPESFRRILIKNNFSVVNFFAFPDHYQYTKKDIENVLRKKCDFFLTTEKDWVKISKIWPIEKEIIVVIPTFVLKDVEKFEGLIYEKVRFS